MSDVRESRHCPLFMPENRRIFSKKKENMNKDLH